jgi:3-oxoacyl-[acyl-carrier-protein] synthase-3
LGQVDAQCGLESVVCHTDGRRHRQFWCEYPASRQHPVRVTTENLKAAVNFPSLDFEAVASFGRETLPVVMREALAKAQRGIDGVDCFIISHILPGVAASAAEALQVSSDRFIDAGSAHGHLTAATLPTALSEALAMGRLRAGQRVLLAACGAGFTWGAAVLTL